MNKRTSLLTSIRTEQNLKLLLLSNVIYIVGSYWSNATYLTVLTTYTLHSIIIVFFFALRGKLLAPQFGWVTTLIFTAIFPGALVMLPALFIIGPQISGDPTVEGILPADGLQVLAGVLLFFFAELKIFFNSRHFITSNSQYNSAGTITMRFIPLFIGLGLLSAVNFLNIWTIVIFEIVKSNFDLIGKHMEDKASVKLN